MDAIAATFSLLRNHFDTGATLDAGWRAAQLTALAQAMEIEEGRMVAALQSDFSKPEAETLTAEIDYVKKEARRAAKQLKRWMKPTPVSTPLAAFPSKSFIRPEPYGVVLIIGAWNYPLQECLAPLVGAIAAGNCAVIKPSELAPAASALLAEIVKTHLDPAAFAVVEGAVEQTTALLDQDLDKIFFTGGSSVGRIVMAAAARTLTPVTLELGGKSPAIVEPDADLQVSARRIAWGRFMNAGQICVAPDYVLVHERVHDAFVEALSVAITEFYGEDPKQSADFARIVNDRHFERIAALIEPDKVVIGGQTDAQERYIAPTVLTGVTQDSPSMGEEVFGPVLPVLSYTDRAEALAAVRGRAAPLAIYLFTRDAAFADQVIAHTRSGTVMINDAVIFQANAALPFGGIGESGMGAFHGVHSFKCFSHDKSVMKRGFALDSALRYPPYDAKKLATLRKLA
jgi:acyl-CoA reductase-like NAD-dependent aldehyde dehydrogenase